MAFSMRKTSLCEKYVVQKIVTNYRKHGIIVRKLLVSAAFSCIFRKNYLHNKAALSRDNPRLIFNNLPLSLNKRALLGGMQKLE